MSALVDWEEVAFAEAQGLNVARHRDPTVDGCVYRAMSAFSQLQEAGKKVRIFGVPDTSSRQKLRYIQTWTASKDGIIAGSSDEFEVSSKHAARGVHAHQMEVFASRQRAVAARIKRQTK